jgi:hypothetical protein
MNETMRLSWLNPNIGGGSAKQCNDLELMKIQEARQKRERDQRLEEINNSVKN